MSLIEQLHYKMIEKGLILKIISFLPKISILCTIIGICWLTIIIPMEGNFRTTYISENALMPTQAYSYFRESEWNILRGYRAQVEILKPLPIQDRNMQVKLWLEDFGVKSAVYQDKEYGETLYGVLNAPRGDGTESIVLVAPWKNSEDEYNAGGVALALSLSRFFSRWPVWSKNIIVVLSDNPEESLRAWVKAYHTSLDLTGGSIESAVILDYPGTNDFFQYIELYYDGLNGELPNLDLVNIAVHIAEHEGMKVSLHGLPYYMLELSDYKTRLRTMLLGIKNLALAGVKKCHGNEAFSGWRIQSVTLKSRGDDGPFDITTFGRVAEGIFRSVNNLLEKFHQSFFFYILLSPRKFVSIGDYLPAAVTIFITFGVSSLNSILNNKYASLHLLSIYTIWAIIAFTVSLLVSFITSQIFFYLPYTKVLLIVNIVISVIPLILQNFKIQEPFTYRARFIAYLYLSIVLTSLLVVNFALAFCIGILAFPMTLIKTVNNKDLWTMTKNSLLLLLSNPFISVRIFSHIVEPDLNTNDIFYKLISSWAKLGCWTWFVICIGWFPSWLLIVCSSFYSTSTNLIHEKKIV